MDKKDWVILEELKKDSRRTVKQLAKEVDLPPSTVHDRIKKMLEEGVIEKFTVEPNYSKIGKPITAYTLVRYYKAGNATIIDLGKEIGKHQQVEEVHAITGDWDLLVKSRMSSMDELSDFLLHQVRLTEGAGRGNTYLSLVRIK